ncbi:mitochondrial carrier [Mycena floridula]|nr:mitochondrial carrier [Mycena floridula]
MSEPLRAVKDITFGSIAGMAAKIFEHPFDLTKVRLQAQLLTEFSASAPKFAGPIDCLRKTHANEGFRGLYRGLPAPLVGSMAENASLFLVYEELKILIGKDPLRLTLREKFAAACGAGAVTSFILTPIELIKCKMQVQGLSAHQTSFLQTIRQTLRAGPLSMWTGHTGTFIRETGGTGVWFGVKEAVSGWLSKKRIHRQRLRGETSISTRLTPLESALSGACAGAAFNLAFFPADTVKSAMQTSTDGSSRSFLQTLTSIVRTAGLKGLYAGCGITIARSIPSSAMIFLIWDGLWGVFP